MQPPLGAFSAADPVVGPLHLESDGFGAGDEPLKLALHPVVQRYLAVSPEEVQEIERIWRRYRDALNQLYDADATQAPPDQNPTVSRAKQRAEAEIAQLLDEQRGRSLRALSWRLRGGLALLDDDVAAALQLSPEQRAAFERTSRENAEEFARSAQGLAGARVRPERYSEILAAHRQVSSERMLAILTPEQRDRFRNLQSE